MRIGKLFRVWSTITGRDRYSMKIHEKFSKIVLVDQINTDRMADWAIRKCDRGDWIDWMPYRMSIPGHQIRVYYVNVNPDSTVHDHSLVLVLHGGTRAVFDEWDGDNLISSVPAVIESDPSVEKPSEDEFNNMVQYAMTNGSIVPDGPTIDGKPVSKRD